MTPPYSIKSHHSQKGAGVHQQLLTHPCLFFCSFLELTAEVVEVDHILLYAEAVE